MSFIPSSPVTPALLRLSSPCLLTPRPPPPHRHDTLGPYISTPRRRRRVCFPAMTHPDPSTDTDSPANRAQPPSSPSSPMSSSPSSPPYQPIPSTPSSLPGKTATSPVTPHHPNDRPHRLRVLHPASVFRFLRYSPERLRIVLLSFLSFIICNCDRINISVAILPMAKYYGWSQTTSGLVQSAFFWGYVFTQIPGGYIADRFGGKHVLSFGVITWSAMTLLTPMAANFSNIGVLLAARALLGLGEGVAMPAVNNIVSKWVPESERARSLSLIYSGMYMGSVVGLSLCPTFIVAFGWQSVFYFFGGLGFFWWALWQVLATSTPQLSTTITEEERAYILQQDVEKPEVTASTAEIVRQVPWVELLTNSATWAIIAAHFCTTWGYFVLLTWLPTYFNQKLGFDLAASSFLSILPWLAMFVFANVGGVIADTMRAQGMSTTRVRKIMQTIGMMGPAIFLGLVSISTRPTLAIGFMTSALALGSFTQSGVYSNHQDIGPQYAGILLGISNTAAAIPGIVGVALTGYILDQTGSWGMVFGIAIGFYVFGTLMYNLFATGERVFK